MNLVFTKGAERDLARLSRDVASRIVAKLLWFADNFEQQIPERLSADARGFYKFRVGDWRTLYTIDGLRGVLVVHMIGHRSVIYKRWR